ncbi:MAG: rubrerythrin [Herbinix sp.]|jgi:rubrerythrin|nr:rubrerythrin [Herbinix sp.]
MNTIDFAIKMELEGQKYYLEQSEINKDNELHTVFAMLAASEMEHAELLQRYKMREALYLSRHFIRPDIKPVFRDLKSFQKEHTEKQLDAYRLASIQEEKSIELYQEMLNEAVEPSDKEVFEFLIGQEKEHLNLFEDLVIMLLRPEEWVESAEFGVREDY